MSEELRDEAEAINSIYGEGTLVAADDGDDNGHGEQQQQQQVSATTYILKLPGDASSLRLRFPASYPAQPPEALGTHHSSGGRKGAGARDLGLFREALAGVFAEGAVCLFDAVEEFSRMYEEEKEAAEEAAEAEAAQAQAQASGKEQHDGSGSGNGIAGDGDDASLLSDAALSSLPPPPWTLSELLVDTKSTFLAHVAPVTSPSQARLYVRQLLASDRRFRSATHNMSAWRIRGEGPASFQDCDDDGETAAGSRLLHLMRLMDLWDAMVVVSRWYGGVKLGPRRFAVINAVARDAFVRAGMVVDKEKKGKGGK